MGDIVVFNSMNTAKILMLLFVLILAVALVAFLSFNPQKTGIIPPEIYFISYTCFIFLAGVMLVVLLRGFGAKKTIEPLAGQGRKYDISLGYDFPGQKLTLQINKDVFELYIPSRLSFRMFHEAIESFRNRQYIGCVNLCHSSVEHAIIAELRGGYKKDSPFSTAELPKMYQDKIAEFIKNRPQAPDIKDNAIKLWNMNRLTYVQTLAEGSFDSPANNSPEANLQRRQDYCANEESLIAGVESIAYESLITAASVHKSIGTLY